MSVVMETKEHLPSLGGGSPAAKSASQRIHYLDNLRAMAMLLGVYLHAAFAYADPSQSFWLATDPDSSVGIDASIWFIHLFRMSLFFFLSGYFAKLVLDRKGIKAFVWGRITRIAVPFVLFYPFLLGAITAVIVFSLSYVETPKGLMGVIASSVASETTSAAAQTPTTMHLWFLYYLFMFNVLSAALYHVNWIRVDWLFARPVIWLFVPLLLIPGILGAGVPLPAPESFVPTWWPFAFFGLFYFVGWHLRGRELVLERLGSYLWHFVVVSVVLFVAYYWSMPTLDLSLLATVGDSPEWNPYPLATLCTAFLSVLLTLSSLLLGKRYMQGRNAVLALISDASYWIYLIHLPIAIFLQTLLLPLNWPAELKLMIVLLGTTVPCMATYLVFVRYTPIGWLLHGKRSFP